MIVRLLFFLLVTTAAHAGLQFAETALVVKATPQDKTLQARYKFTNSGSVPIGIIQLTTSCGCTVAVTDKNLYQPGDSGLLTATFTIGLSEGHHHYTLTLQTSEENTPPYTLQFTAELPSGQSPLVANAITARLTPGELAWSRQPYATKTVTIDLQTIPGTKISATCDSDQFQLTLDESTGAAILHVTPSQTAASTRAEVILQFTPPNGPAYIKKIPLLILSLKSRSP